MKCSSCAIELTPVFAGDHEAATTGQFDNVLVLHVAGGYGMFVDNLYEEEPFFVLCHDCSHMFCNIFDPERQLIDPYTSHSHKADSVETGHEEGGKEVENKNVGS